MEEVMPPGTAGAKHVAEAGRYHLFVSGVCPWASSCRSARHLLGLEGVVSMDVADGQSGAGWVLLNGTACSPWAATAASGTPFYLHEVYRASDPLCASGTTHITMPVLWDKHLNIIVSNDSWAIVKMFATAFRTLGTAPEGVGLGREEEVDAVHKQWSATLLNTVYQAGVPLMMRGPEARETTSDEVYASLDELEALLATQRFVMEGDEPTAVDLFLFSKLIRFDVAFMHCMGLHGGRGGILVPDSTDQSKAGTQLGYPNVADYTRDMYQRLKPCVDWSSFTQYYRSTKLLPPTAALPDIEYVMASADQPHGRGGETHEVDSYSWMGDRVAIWAQSPKPSYTLETQRYAQPSRCIPLLRPGQDLIVLPGAHEGTREAWEFHRDTLGLGEEQAVWTSGSLYNMDDDVDDHIIRQLKEAMTRQPDTKFLLIPYCPTPNFVRWAQPLQDEMGADKLAIFAENQEWIEKYGDKGILHRHMSALEMPSVIELIDPSINVPRGFVCTTQAELRGARKLLAGTKVCIKPLAGATGVGILLDVSDEQIETYDFPLGPVNLEELLQLDRDADGEAISPAL
mmetsp:Transcript_71650/g.202536  ORF Transcript_71650/g.202536 Transcript_71650/m.202536 type:complete len:571 (+) Transcript_71650:356-2068(+)